MSSDQNDHSAPLRRRPTSTWKDPSGDPEIFVGDWWNEVLGGGVTLDHPVSHDHSDDGATGDGDPAEHTA